MPDDLHEPEDGNARLRRTNDAGGGNRLDRIGGADGGVVDSDSVADLREQWEYRETNSGSGGGVQTDFAMMGERGWELVAATPRTAADTITGKPYSYVVHAWKRRIV